MTIVVAVVALVVMLASYVTWVAGRIDRMQVRVHAAHTALDAQLVRRAALARELAGLLRAHQLGDAAKVRSIDSLAREALGIGDGARELVENELTEQLARSVAELPSEPTDPRFSRVLADLDVATTKVGFAVSFHNDAVRDMLMLRQRRLPRLLRPPRRTPLPTYVDIGDTPLGARPEPGPPRRVLP